MSSVAVETNNNISNKAKKSAAPKTTPSKKAVVPAIASVAPVSTPQPKQATKPAKKVAKPAKAAPPATEQAVLTPAVAKVVPKKRASKNPVVKAEKKVATEVVPETAAEDLSANLLKMNYNVDSKGHAYRTFKLKSVDGKEVEKEHAATQSSRKPIKEYDEKKFRFILCPRNAASKIFTSWSYSNKEIDVLTTSHVICIKETTRKSSHRDFYYKVIREAKENTYCVTSADGVKKSICSKFTNRLQALKKKDLVETVATTPVVPTTA